MYAVIFTLTSPPLTTPPPLKEKGSGEVATPPFPLFFPQPRQHPRRGVARAARLNLGGCPC